MFTLIELPYAMEVLEPVISAQTLSFHHGKHLVMTKDVGDYEVRL